MRVMFACGSVNVEVCAAVQGPMLLICPRPTEQVPLLSLRTRAGFHPVSRSMIATKIHGSVLFFVAASTTQEA